MSDRTTPDSNYEILDGQLIEPDTADADAVACEDQAIHLLLTAWTLVLEEEQQHRSARRPSHKALYLGGGADER